MIVERYRTAIARSTLSTPVQHLLRNGLLDPSKTFFDYGCGRGGDVSRLVDLGFVANGWDPHYKPASPRVAADVVNLGFVLNVIEDEEERAETLRQAYALTRSVLAVGVRGWTGNSRGEPYRDGVLTTRKTFQKYFARGELKRYVEDVLGCPAIPCGQEVAFVLRPVYTEFRDLSKVIESH